MKKSKIFLSILTPAATILAIAPAISLTGCGGGSKPSEQPTITKVEVTSTKQALKINQSVQLTATVTGTGQFSKEVTWSIVRGTGTVNSTGLFSAGDTLGVTTVKATSNADTTKFGIIAITVTNQIPINKNVTHGTIAGPSEMGQIGTASFTLVPNTGYKLPSSITVTGASGADTYDSSTGTFTISNPTAEEIVITAVCPEKTATFNVNCTKKGDVDSITVLTQEPSTSKNLEIQYEFKSSLSHESGLIFDLSFIKIGINDFKLTDKGITHDKVNKKITVDKSLLTGDDVTVDLYGWQKAAPSTPSDITIINAPTCMQVGEQVQLKYEFTRSITEADVRWEIIDEYSEYLSIDEYGLVTAKKEFNMGEGLPANNIRVVSKENSSAFSVKFIKTFNPITTEKVTTAFDSSTGYFNGTHDFVSRQWYEISFDFSQIINKTALTKAWTFQVGPGNSLLPAYYIRFYVNDTEIYQNQHWTNVSLGGNKFGIFTAVTVGSKSVIYQFPENAKLRISFYAGSTASLQSIKAVHA